eukprot:TRINITY_DN70360_c0_g1_i1.p2 TRINITY_DN70360_c0_g1~~TRINITY_DN70360_c0_g1_i1.p2  ORF type:complete len:332 (+),score=129.31 TRINITY_DN70360_c0_g1_i1:97-996(+)
MAPTATDREYLQQHNVPNMIDDFLAALCTQRPSDPVVFAGKYFKDKSRIKPLVAGNWKSNATVQMIKDLSSAWNAVKISHDVDVFIAPSLLYCKRLQKELVNPAFKVAAQNCTEKNGAFTGECSAEMIKDAGVPWVILGHSERRAIYGETDAVVAAKVAAALKAGLLVCACVGESLAERESGQTMQVVLQQTAAIAAKVMPHQWADVVIAYEPVWAIGTGKVATPQQAQEVHAGIRAWLSQNCGQQIAGSTRILYGGSVAPKNAADLWAQQDINGFLVGGASLKPDFIEVINATAKDKP